MRGVPAAVSRPGSVADVVRVVRHAYRHRVPVAVQGQGHGTGGQAQAAGGIVVDTRTLATIHRIEAGAAVVDAGVRWLDLVHAAAAHGLTPPVLPDFLELSVGGTLSVGGIGGATQHHGMQVDTVLAVDVVTGRGELHRCSARRRRRLFEAVLGGLGQFGVIVRATVRLVPAPETVRSYHLHYADLDRYLTDQRRLVADGRFDSLQGQVLPGPGRGWSYLIDAARYGSGAPPDDAALLAGLGADPARTVVAERPFAAWAARLGPAVELARQLGWWQFPHPWLNLFLPASRTGRFVAAALARLSTEDTGSGPVLLYPFRTARLTRPLVRVPDEPVAFLFAVLRTAVPPEPAVVRRLVEDNRTLYERARRVGGSRYPVGTVAFGPADWARHFGRRYPAVLAAKARYDPRRVLGPGVRLVPPARG